MPPRISSGKEALLTKWFEMNHTERTLAHLPLTHVGIMEKLKISNTTFAKYQAIYWEKKNANVVDPRHKEATDLLSPQKKVIEDEDFNFSKWKKNMTQPMADYLFKAAQEGKPSAIKLFFELAGEYVQKQEIKVGLTGDEIARRNLEAERELRESGYRVSKVSEEPALLSEELRDDSEPSTAGDNPVD